MLFTAAATNPMVQNFALVYLQMGLPPVGVAERSALLPSLLVGAARRPSAQADTLWPMLLANLPTLPLPKRKVDVATALPFLSDASDRALVLGWLLDLLLYLPPLASDPHTPPPGLSRTAA